MPVQAASKALQSTGQDVARFQAFSGPFFSNDSTSRSICNPDWSSTAALAISQARSTSTAGAHWPRYGINDRRPTCPLTRPKPHTTSGPRLLCPAVPSRNISFTIALANPPSRNRNRQRNRPPCAQQVHTDRPAHADRVHRSKNAARLRKTVNRRPERLAAVMVLPLYTAAGNLRKRRMPGRWHRAGGSRSRERNAN
jgi:hypothetical protein